MLPHQHPPCLDPQLIGVQVSKLVCEIDMKTKEQKKAKYIKQVSLVPTLHHAWPCLDKRNRYAWP